jgi:hypothetical protein
MRGDVATLLFFNNVATMSHLPQKVERWMTSAGSRDHYDWYDGGWHPSKRRAL